jgi:HPt (histidine-containing phosphotransfer) domain-containing protein
MVPVVGLSGAVNDELQVQAASAGMSDLVEKSFDSDILGSLIRKWLPWVRRWAAAPTLPSQRSGEADQPSPETAFDLSVLQSATGADEGELQEFADRAVQDISDAAAVLVHSARAADARHCRSVAHRAKGSARVIGAQRAARVLDEIEAAALSGSIEDVRGLLDRLSDELTLLSDAREAVR